MPSLPTVEETSTPAPGSAGQLAQWPAAGARPKRGRSVADLGGVVARNSAFGLAAQMIIKVLSFGFSVLVVRHLGADAYGQYAAVLAFGAMFVFVADLGLSGYAVREVAGRPDAADRRAGIELLYSNILPLRFLLSVLAAVLVIGAAWITNRPPVMIGAIALGTVGLIVYSAYGASEALLAGLERLDLSAGTKVLNQLAFVVVGGLALWLGFGYYGLVVANLVGIVVMTLACARAVKSLGVRVRAPVVRMWPSLLRASIPFGVIGLTLGLSYKFDSVLLDIFRGDTETGYYNAAYNLVFSAVLISNVLNAALYPSLARQAADAAESLGPLYERILRYLMILGLPIAVGVWASADRLVPFLFTDAYLPAVAALRIVIWVVPFMFASEFLGYVVVIRGQERRVARAVMVSTSLNVALNLVLVPWLGFIGASVMTVVTEAVLVGQYVWLLRSEFRLISWDLTLLRPACASAVMGCIVLAAHALPVPELIGLAALSYPVLLLALRVAGPEELRFLRGLRQTTIASPSVAAD